MKMITQLTRFGLALALLSVNAAVFAQNASRDLLIGFGFNAGVPTISGYNYVIGFDARAQKDLSRSVAAIASIGYSEFQQGSATGIADFAIVPFKVGAKIFPLQRLYLIGEIGSAIKTYKARESEFIWAPGLGYNFDNGLDLGLRYEETRRRGATSGQVALRVAYNFNFSEMLRKF